jgi:hypothetical protein
MRTFYIGLGKNNEIRAATVDCPDAGGDIKSFLDSGLKVLKVQAETITIGHYWGYEPEAKNEIMDDKQIWSKKAE